MCSMKVGDIVGFSGKPWPQYQEEIRRFIDLLKEENCGSYIEVGCRYGDTFHAVGMSLPKGSVLVAIDLPGAKSGMKNKGGHQDSGVYLEKAVKDLCDHDRFAMMILGDSQDSNVVTKAISYGPYDALLIDGDHTAEGVLKDLLNYGPHARLVAFHDVCGQGKWARQIRPIFEEFAKGKKSVVFAKDKLRRGIGVVWNR